MWYHSLLRFVSFFAVGYKRFLLNPFYIKGLRVFLAEREGFEPSLGLTLNTLSRRAPSATQPPLRNFVVMLYVKLLLWGAYVSKPCFVCKQSLRLHAFYHAFYGAFKPYTLPFVRILSSAAKLSILSSGIMAFSASAGSTNISLPVGSIKASFKACKPFIAIHGQ